MVSSKFNSKNRLFTFLQNHSTEIFCFLCFFAANLCLLIILFPFDRPITGHDFQYHYLRVEAIKYNIQNNNLFSGIDYLYFGGGGYAGFAYPEIFLYIPAVLRIFGAGIAESMCVLLSLCSVFSYCTMFIFLKNISGSPICGTMGAVLYVLSAYRIDNIITRFALGEILAYVFWPLIIYGLYDFIFDDFKKPHILGLGFAGMLLSHTISTVIALGFAVIISAIFIKRIVKTREKLPKLLVTAGCAAAVTAFYWLPLIEFVFSCDMSVSKTAYHTLDYVIPFVGLFKENMHNGIAGMGFPVFLLCVPRVFLTRNSPVSKKYLRDEKSHKRKNILVAADTFMIFGIFFAIMATNIVPWKFLSAFLDFMQFPWRFFAPASILLIIAGTVYIYYTAKFTKAPKTAMVLITAAAIIIAGVHAGISGVGHAEKFETDHYSNTDETYHIGAGEWLPQKARNGGLNVLRSMGENVVLSNGDIVPCERKNGTLTFDLNGKNVSYAKLPYVWYKGYEAKDENGSSLEITMSNKGLVQVNLDGASGKITVEHKPTALKFVGGFISVLSAAALTAVSIVLRRKRKCESKPSDNYF